MISYKEVARYKYTKNPSDVVALKEYILFEDCKNECKHALLRFANNLNQPLFGIQFEVYQYDGADNLIAKSLVVYDKFNAEANSEFVPKAKLKLSVNCATISVKLISADFDCIRWEKGSFTNNSYKFKRYVADTYAKSAPRGEMPFTDIVPYEQPKKQKKQKIVSFEMRDVYSKNIARFPRIFSCIAAILLIAFVIGTVIWFGRTSKRITIGDYDVLISSEDTVSIMSYDGDEKIVTVPAKLGEYEVAKISKGAFSNSKVESVTFLSENFIIADGAFKDCESLASVIADKTVSVQGGAFENCRSLVFVQMPLASVAPGAFRGSYNIGSFNVLNCNADKFADLFGAGGHVRLELNMRLPVTVSSEFFDNVKISNLVPKNSGYGCAFGALKNVEAVDGVKRLAYEYYDCVEVMAGTVTDVISGVEEFTVPEKVRVFDAANFAGKLSSVKSVVIKAGLKADAEFFGAFSRLEKVTVENPDAVTKGALSASGAKEFSAPVLSGKLADYLQGSSVNTVTVTGGEMYFANSDYLEGLTVSSLSVSDAVEISGGALISLKYNYSLRSLSVPLYALTSLANMYPGISELTLKKLTLNGSKNCDVVYDKTFAEMNPETLEELIINCESAADNTFNGIRHLNRLELNLDNYGDSFAALFGKMFDGDEIVARTVRQLVLDTFKIPDSYFNECADYGITFNLVKG